MRRLYTLLPDPDSCRRLVEELRGQGIADTHMHVVASAAMPLDDLPQANAWQTTELAHGLEIGVGLGGAAGLLAGLAALSFPPAGLAIGGGAVLASAAAGAGFGALASAMMKGHEHNHRLHEFQQEIEAGRVLLLVDVPRARAAEIRDIILRHHPQAEIRSVRPRN
ncbi:MAG TPA: DUF1269 domain-containing protein [Sedimenticola thiotaurini]|uniref:DUF1269 domain-containing protein n=1 Tax=Sedimenticola thiotaurini TaxID=1543721 RepID=A0A831W4T8_9GAMM|nr:DUF1269 domain-containing protein [Sedimenticola thiotaurini]